MTTLTDDQLLRALATACGWTCEIGEWDTVPRYHIKDNKFGTVISIGTTEEAAWNTALREGRWLRSVDAAMGLPWPKRDATGHYLFDIRIDPDGHADVDFYRVEDSLIRNNGDDTDAITDDWSADGDMLARALCEVFYAWATAQKERQP